MSAVSYYSIITKLGGRRFLLTFLTLVGLVALRATDHLGDTAFSSVYLGTIGAFIAAEGTQRHMDQRHEQVMKGTPP